MLDLPALVEYLKHLLVTINVLDSSRRNNESALGWDKFSPALRATTIKVGHHVDGVRVLKSERDR